MSAAPQLVVAPSDEMLADARRVGLRHVYDRQPGITRRRSGRSFRYLQPDGATVRDPAALQRIESLVIPPAWTDVWICRDANGHLQATGRDARGRKQYRYHARFREARDETKYDRLFAFAAALPKIRGQVERDLRRQGLSREKVLAAVVRLLEQTLIRVGNEEYSRLNQSFGLTTLRDGHARIRGAQVQFNFRGKSGKEHAVSISDRRLARIVKRCRDIPGEELFQYLDADGERHAIDSADVNDYLRAIAGDDFTAKDFRTFAGTVLAAVALAEAGPGHNQSASKRAVVDAIKQASERLGNTPTVCRKCYVHPGILDAYLRGSVVSRVRLSAVSSSAKLRPDERAVINFLRRHLDVVKREQAPGGLVKVLQKSVVATKRTPARRRARG